MKTAAAAAAILVIRERDRFSEILIENGFEVENFPVIQTLPVEDLSGLDAEIERLEIYDGLFFTSPHAARVFLSQAKAKNAKFNGKAYVLGRRAKRLFEKTDFKTVYRQAANTIEEFIDSFDKTEFAGKRFLFVRGEKSLRAIPDLLERIARVEEVVVYRTVENSDNIKNSERIAEKLSQKRFDWVCFFSPSGVEGFIKRFGAEVLKNLRIAAIGTTTAKSAAEKNLEVDFISPKANAEDFALALVKRINEFE